MRDQDKNRRTAYQREMDQAQLSEEKVRETLCLMLEKTGNSAGKTGGPGAACPPGAEPRARQRNVVIRSRQDQASGAWQVQSAFDSSEELVTGRQEISLDQAGQIWSHSEICLPAYSEAGNLLPFTQWMPTGSGPYGILNTGGGFALTEQPLPAGEAPIGCSWSCAAPATRNFPLACFPSRRDPWLRKASISSYFRSETWNLGAAFPPWLSQIFQQLG